VRKEGLINVDKLPVQKKFESGEAEEKKWPGWFERVLLWLEKENFYKISKRINFLLSRVNNNKLEIVADGNTGEGQDGNWKLTTDASGNLIIQENISGTWTDSGWKLKRSP
jgi:hypothetical protein